MAQVERIDETGGRPFVVGMRHRIRHDVPVIGEEGPGHVEPLDLFIGLADPVKPGDGGAAVAQRPAAFRRQEGKAAFPIT